MTVLNCLQIGAVDAPPVVFGHGWARDHRDFIPVAEALAPVARSYLLDLPGFGASPRPDAAWGTAEYATHLRDYIQNELGLTRYIWVGHSFGGRIGLRLGVAGAPLDHLVIVAGAGVPRDVSVYEQMRRDVRRARFRYLRRRAKNEQEILDLEERFGSADYVQSRALGLRDIFTATISEDQSAQLGRILCPTTLIYGGKDTETPPEIGRKMADRIVGATYVECPEFDHISVLDRGRHQIALAVKSGLEARA